MSEVLMNEILLDALSHKGRTHVSKLNKLITNLYNTAQLIADLEDRLWLARKSVRALRALREKYGRARRNVDNSRKLLLLAKNLLQDQVSELKRGWLKFSAPLRDLERLERKLSVLESTCAALIHPQPRTATEIQLAKKTPYKLHHPELRVSEGSADLQYLAVKLVDDELQKFTGGRSDHANRFISEFLRISLGWTVTPSNVKTMRKRIKDKKILESSTATASGKPTSVR